MSEFPTPVVVPPSSPTTTPRPPDPSRLMLEASPASCPRRSPPCARPDPCKVPELPVEVIHH